MMQLFKSFLEENGVDYFVLEVPGNLVPELALVNEGRWVQSGKKDWMVRVDAENSSIKQQRHVHTARAKHINSKTMQASWNQDTTRHDNKTFNSKIGSLKVVQSIAKQALNLSDDICLEELSRAANVLLQLNESLGVEGMPIVFKLKRI
jgi:hypothetical protein